MATEKAFEAFIYKDRKYLSFPTQGGIHVIDDEGHNFGSYFNRSSFRKMIEKHGVSSQIVGKAALTFQVRPMT